MTNDLDRVSTDLVKSLGRDELADLGGTIGCHDTKVANLSDF